MLFSFFLSTNLIPYMLGTAITALAALGSLASAAPQWGDHHLEHDGHSHGEQIPLG